MKRLFQSLKSKQHMRSRQRVAAKQCRRRKVRRVYKRQIKQGLPKLKNRIKKIVKAPNHLSLVDNADEVLSFIETIRIQFEHKRDVSVDLADVEKISSDAVAVLVACIKDKRFRNGCNIEGNRPSQSNVDKVLKEIGFYKLFKSTVSEDVEPKGKIYKRRGVKVEMEIIDDVRDYAVKFVYGKKEKNGGLQRALIECMANTRDHAAGQDDDGVKWWTTVFLDTLNTKACFSFVDTGVGIFNSLKMKTLLEQFKKLTEVIGLNQNCNVLREIIDGQLGTRTKLKYRGKGLPAIYKAFERKQLSRLVIISNDAYADFENKVFRSLRNDFNGTFLYWEIKKSDL